ncbi:ABC transporter permease [Psychrobacillus vulpis]|uniref:ABC transporter permease n=1 Tax=Psychrobacillus vulpis TaxID=2325572 RepID=A0A544TVN2_9BACI|nr:ABC transporter permease [Psychrobacillus vulpis]TQR21481.1 ABC transporter permease [Psychrobacillus vulpis]
MLLSLIGKQMKMLLRNKQPLIILLVMPLVLITILSTALAGVMDNGGESAIQARLVILDESNWEQEEESIKSFIEEQGVSGSALDALLTQVKMNDPIHILENSILASKEVGKYISVEKKKATDLNNLRKDKNIDGILMIPSNFRLNYIKSAYFGVNQTPDIDVFLSQENEIRASIIQSVIQEWQNGFTKSLVFSKAGISPNEIMQNTENVKKIEQELQERERKIPASIYYTVGMLVMFALYIPTFLSGFALQEVQWKVYDRLILAGVSSTLYTVSIFITGTIVAVMQQAIILIFGKLVLGIDWIGAEGMLVIVLGYSFFIGGLSSLLTTLQLRTKSEGAANIFSGFVVSIFAFLGGSFFNIGDVSSLLANIGNFTPNGATMTAILSIQKGQQLEVIWSYISALFVWFILCVLLSIVLFPKRGGTS